LCLRADDIHDDSWVRLVAWDLAMNRSELFLCILSDTPNVGTRLCRVRVRVRVRIWFVYH
jgi:hypothetical protein